jgi:hypothetical protein
LTAAYIEKGVGREGLRELLHLNPFEFTSNEEIIADVKSLLTTWYKSSADDTFGTLELESTPGYEGGIQLRHLAPILTNRGKRANEYSCTLEIPEELLSFSSGYNVTEVARTRPNFRRFQATEVIKNGAPLLRDNPMKMLVIQVAIAHLNEAQREHALNQYVQVSADIGDRAYSITKSCAEIFAGAPLPQPEKVKEQSVQQQQPVYHGPDGWMDGMSTVTTVCV